MKISIIVPIYKTEKYLRKCIDSILAQAYKDFELILVDDGSPDSCPQICDEYAKKDDRIMVIHKENGGLQSAWRAGVDLATREGGGDYLCFTDSDDYIEPDMLSEFANKIAQYNADIVACGYSYEYLSTNTSTPSRLVPEEGFYQKTNGTFEGMRFFPSLTDSLHISGARCNHCIKKQVFLSALKFSHPSVRIGEGMSIIFPCIMAANSYYHIGKSMYRYVQIEGSMLGTYRQTDFDDWKNVRAGIEAAADAFNYLIPKKDEVAFRFLISLCLGRLRASNLDKKTKKQYVKEIIESAEVQKLLEAVKHCKKYFNAKVCYYGLKYKLYPVFY